MLFVSTNFSFGENKFKPGYVITLCNDTLHGYIDYKKWETNPNKILFKETMAGAGSYFTPELIWGFHTNGEVYRSANVKIEQSSIKKNELSLTRDFIFITDLVFLRAVILGEKELFQLKDSRGKESYYIKKDSIYEWLVYKKYLVKERSKEFIAINNNYIGQLIEYLQGCNSINSVLSKTTYGLNSMIKAYNYYYDCVRSNMLYRFKYGLPRERQ